MICRYVINGQETRCFYGEFSGLTVYDTDGRTPIGQYDLEVDKQTGDQFFMIDEERILLKDMVCDTPEEFMANIAKRNENHLCNVLLKYGLDSLTVMRRVKPLKKVKVDGVSLAFNVTSKTDKPTDMGWIEYKFVDEYMFRPEHCYKVKIMPKGKKLKDMYPTEEYFVEDFIELLNEQSNLFQVKATEKKEKIEKTC